MKKLRNLLLVGTALTLGLTSCNNNDGPGPGDGDNVARFTSNINPLGTRVADGAWEATDNVGVFATASGSSLSSASYALNKKYVVDDVATGKLIGSAGEEITFPTDGSNLDFIAYYPYQATAAGTLAYAVDVTDQSDFSKIDLLYSNNLTAKNQSSTNLSLQFGHKLSMVSMEIGSQNSFADMSNLTVKITGVKTTSSFNLVDGVTFTDGATTGEITAVVTPRAGNATAVVEAFVIPATDLTGVKFVFSVEGKTFTFDSFAGKTFTSGTKHTYSFTLQSGGSVVGFESGNSGIGGWNGSDEGGGNLDPAGGDGSEANPFSVAEALTKVGETGVWVKGFVVGVDENMTRAAGNNFEAPFVSNTNILLAASATENDMANCITVVLPAGDIRDALNLVDNATELLGAEVSVKGNINEDGDGKFLGSVTDQKGGVEPGPGPGGDPVEFFKEDFGAEIASNTNVTAYTGWTMGAPISYTDSYDKASVRKTSTINPHVWLPNVSGGVSPDSELLISGIDQLGSYSDITLSYDIATNDTAGTPQTIKVYYAVGEGEFTEITIPTEYVFSDKNIFVTITLNGVIPNGVSKLRFYGQADVNVHGYRIDNITLTGVPAN